MFKIEDDIIKITRANRAIIDFSLSDYTFKTGDIVEFKIYGKSGLDKPPLKTKQVIVTNDCSSLDIELTKEDTDIGIPENKVVDYWYELELNGDQTVIGYDDNKGPKILKLYPKGVENND